MWLGVNIGGTKCSVSCGCAEKDALRILRSDTIPTQDSPERMFERLAALAETLLQGAKPESVGISCGGPLDSKKGLILSPPNLPGWDEVPAVRWAEDRFSAPARLVNDANAAALAEWRFGAGRGCEDMLFLTCGTGIGAGLILGGRLYEGFGGMAGEIGHVRLEKIGPVGYGKAGSVEGMCSGSGLAQIGAILMKERTQRGLKTAYADDCTGGGIAKAALAGDDTAREVFRIAGDALGRALAILIDVLNPRKIVLGSIYLRSAALLEDAMWAAIRSEALEASWQDCRIVPGQWGEELGDAAALTVAGGFGLA